MSAISFLSSFSNRPAQGALLQSTQQGQRGTTYGSASTARGSNTANTSSAYCPTCGGGASSARSTSASSSYCPTCNRAGGAQSNITNFNSAASRTSAATTKSANSLQGGQICVSCAYQGR